MDEHTPRMRALARRMLRDESDTEEVVQDAFLYAFRSLDRFRPSIFAAVRLSSLMTPLSSRVT